MNNAVLSDNDRKKLGSLISWAVNGPEHGVQSMNSWRWNCWELVKLCKELGIPVHGQWAIEPKDYEPPKTNL